MKNLLYIFFVFLALSAAIGCSRSVDKRLVLADTLMWKSPDSSPSGTKWACCNVGANVPTDCGNYFAWGETTTKSDFKTSNYKWYSGSDNHNITKYNRNRDYGSVDGRTELELEDDAAYVNLGPEWRMPTVYQILELLDNCTSEWTKVNGMDGYLFSSNINNGKVFFPATGFYTSRLPVVIGHELITPVGLILVTVLDMVIWAI